MSMQTAIEEKLAREFDADYLLVENESHMHNVAPGSESQGMIPSALSWG